ncbi:MAG TPA: FkbM family methyltransferase [Candidatus Udaeobacter sp.]|nr:FkbM family methyltransferase [Candidatus Udaeobacter sp.]
MNPHDSLRKILGLYEHELNSWLDQALPRVGRVLDVGANDGYFTFGCAAAFERLGKAGEIIAFEPQARHAAQLLESTAAQPKSSVQIEIIETFVGNELKPGMMTLDAVQSRFIGSNDRTATLIKIDVEGAEVEVIEGGRSWLHPSNLFLIEVHDESFLNRLRAIFAERELRLLQINQRALPILGRETRAESNWWLVTDLGAVSQSYTYRRRI